jgi:hypothetical protein
MVKVTDVKILDGRHLRLGFSDGLVRDVNCEFLFRGVLGEQLRDPAYFKLAPIDPEAGTVVWPNGLDPAPEVLYGDGETVQSSPVDSRAAALLQTAEDIASTTGSPFTEQELSVARQWLPSTLTSD